MADALNLPFHLEEPFGWMYSIGALHMLVADSDRREFLASLRSSLVSGGRLLLVNRGDGRTEGATDPALAFAPTPRTHQGSGTELQVAFTSYRHIGWAAHRGELQEAGFLVEREIDTVNDEYGQCMTVYLRRAG